MVLSEKNENIEAKAVAEKKMESEMKKNLDSMPATQKLFSCAELERSIGLRLTDTLDTKEIMPVDDPAIMSSSKTRLTRYNHEELWALKHSKLSAVTPSCLFDPKIVQFKIMDVRTENEHIANQLKLFTERLRQFDISKFDPSLVQLFANYQTSILNPDVNAFSMQQQQPLQPHHTRHVSFMEPHQSALLDKIPPYDRNNNFFDTITTTTAMPHAYSSYQNHPLPPPVQVGRNQNCAMENQIVQNNVSGKSSNAYFSDNNNNNANSSSKAAMSEDTNKELQENASKKADSNQNLNNDDEPEWYSTPATVNDFVDLHGFEEGLDDLAEKKLNSDNRSPNPNPNGYGTASLAYRRSGYSQNRFPARVNQNHNFNNGPPQYGNNPNYYNQQQHFSASLNQRFRNPLHYQKHPPAMQSPNWPSPTINPFFDMWKRARASPNPNENCSFQALMNYHRVQVPPNVPSITDIESALKSSNYLTSMMNKGPQQQSPLPHASQSVPQFFNNWPQQQVVGGMPNMPDCYGSNMPTQEQLQQHTTEIMRNAIMRKNQQQQQQQQQQYHNEKPQFR